MKVGEFCESIKPFFLDKVYIMADGGVAYCDYLKENQICKYLEGLEIREMYINTNNCLQINVV